MDTSSRTRHPQFRRSSSLPTAIAHAIGSVAFAVALCGSRSVVAAPPGPILQVHFKSSGNVAVGHYAYQVKAAGGRYDCQDLTVPEDNGSSKRVSLFRARCKRQSVDDAASPANTNSDLVNVTVRRIGDEVEFTLTANRENRCYPDRPRSGAKQYLAPGQVAVGSIVCRPPKAKKTRRPSPFD